MRLNKIIPLSIFIILICLIGTVSAAENGNDTAVLSIEEDSLEIDRTLNEYEPVLSESENKTEVSVDTWSQLKEYCEKSDDYIITLSGTEYNITSNITFNNSVTIIGTENSYITGSTSETPFFNSNSTLILHFINVKFINITTDEHLLYLYGTSYFENCTFDNITTGYGRNSVIINSDFMYLSNCTISNCHTGYGAVSNYNSNGSTKQVMHVDDCKFENNYAEVEPGAINNCGILFVNNSEFIKNGAYWWAGAIHTHCNAQSDIKNSIFKKNYAGWNGGALYTYSLLTVYNTTFEDNNCSTNNGGGAIGAYNYISKYNITIDSCTFKNNINLCDAYTDISSQSVGRGGAISVLNGGSLEVRNSNFTGNYAKIGQAIAAITAQISGGDGGNPSLKIYNNQFVNHTANGIDTVYISGSDFVFNNNMFIDSYQDKHYTGTGNKYQTTTSIDISSPEEKIVIITLKDANDNPVSNANIQYSINGEKKTGITDDNGIITLTNLIGEVAITAVFEETESYLPSNNTANFTMPKLTTAINIYSTQKGVVVITINNAEGNGISGVNVKYTVNGESRTGVSDENGTITISDLTNEVVVSAVYEGNEIYYASNSTASFNFTIPKISTTITISSTKKGVVVIAIRDTDDNGISNVDITYKINGENKIGTTDENGTITITGLTNEITISAIFTGNEIYYASNNTAYFNFTKIATGISSAGVTTYYNVGKNLVATLKDANGNVLANKKVTVNFNGKTYTKVTDANGQITFKLSATLSPKTYLTTITFAGDDSYLNSTVSTKVVVKKATVKMTASAKTFKKSLKTKKYSITLKNNLGKVMKNTKVTLKIKGKTFSAYTNSKGVATFKITKLTKKGKYTSYVKYAESKYYNALNKKVVITLK